MNTEKAYLVVFKIKKFPWKHLSWFMVDGWRSTAVRAESPEQARAIAKKALKSVGQHRELRWVYTTVYKLAKLPPGPVRGKRFDQLVRNWREKQSD